MPFDVDRFLKLRESAVFNCEFWRGHYQDLSRNQYAMAWSAGATEWEQLNGLPVITLHTNRTVRTGLVPAVIDTTGAFSFEWLIRVARVNFAFADWQAGAGNNGGFLVYQNGNNLVPTFFNAAGATRTAVFTLPGGSQTWFHCVWSCPSMVGATSTYYINGIPYTATHAGAVVPTNIVANRNFDIGAIGGSPNVRSTLGRNRLYGSALSAEDATCLYGAARSLIGEV